MGTEPSKQDTNRGMAVLLCLFLAFMYKQMVWDPYFNKTGLNHAPQGLAGSVPGSQPTPTSLPRDPADQFAEPPTEGFQEPLNVAPANTPANTPGKASSTPAAATGQPTELKKGYPTDGQIKEAGEVIVETARVKARISLLGGRVTEYLLKDHAAALGKDQPRLNMVEHVDHAPYPGGVYSGGYDDAWTTYRLRSSQNVFKSQNGVLSEDSALISRVAGEASSAVILEGELPDGRTISKTLTLYGEGYFVDLAVNLSASPADNSRLAVEWTKLVAKDSPSFLDSYATSGYVWFDGQKALRETFSKLHAASFDVSNILWLTVADKYFMATILSDDGAANGRVLRTGDLYRARVFGSDREKRARLFIGPKSYRLLEDVGYELRRNIDVGYTGVISVPLISLLHLLYDYLHNYGLAIVVLTIIVKLLMYPLTGSSFKQMKAMQDLSPELNKIKEGNLDKQQQQMAMMALYKEKGVNPLGGCFPMLLQMPVFIGLYSALMMDLELRHAPFAGWVHDLSAPEALHVFGFGVPVMVILFVASMLIQQWQAPSTMDPAQKRVMMFMPLIFGFMFAGMPAGLTLYWLTNNFISIGQQAGFRREGTGHALRLTLLVAGATFGLCALLVWLS